VKVELSSKPEIHPVYFGERGVLNPALKATASYDGTFGLGNLSSGRFFNVPPGDYTVSFTPPAGYTCAQLDRPLAAWAFPCRRGPPCARPFALVTTRRNRRACSFANSQSLREPHWLLALDWSGHVGERLAKHVGCAPTCRQHDALEAALGEQAAAAFDLPLDAAVQVDQGPARDCTQQGVESTSLIERHKDRRVGIVTCSCSFDNRGRARASTVTLFRRVVMKVCRHTGGSPWARQSRRR